MSQALPAAFHSISPFAEELRAFAAESARGEVPAHQVLFYGSSSVRLWSTLRQDFEGWPVLNRGFGGSTLADCVQEFDRVVAPLEPRALVLYAGDNDLDQGAPPARVLALFEQIARRFSFPAIVLAIKPSPSRFWNAEKIRQANALLAHAIESMAGVQWLDVFSPMLDSQGQPRRELFGEDGLHLSPAGYALWATAVRARLVEMGI